MGLLKIIQADNLQGESKKMFKKELDDTDM